MSTKPGKLAELTADEIAAIAGGADVTAPAPAPALTTQAPLADSALDPAPAPAPAPIPGPFPGM